MNRRSWGENSVNAGQPDMFFVESEETKLYDNNGKKIPHYGSASTEEKESTTSTDASAASDSDVERTRSRIERVMRPRKVSQLQKMDSIASSSSSWSSWSSDSTTCQGFAPPMGPKPWMTLENVVYYLRYATAVYGSSNYGGTYNCQDRIPLCRKYRCCDSDPYLSPDVLEGDNYWECEASSVMLYAHLDRDNMIYANLDNQIFKTPYCIARDDVKKVVVVAIRGTMSAGDALTDLTAHGQDIEIEHLPRGNVHKGILKVARMIKRQMEDQIHLQDKIPKGYNLVLVGHSLGAGVAAILSLLLMDQYPNITCYSFSPPGGLVSTTLSMYLQEFVLTCFLGMDVVARLSVSNLERLKTDILAVIKNSRLPKYKILSSGMQALCCGCVERDESILLEDTHTTKLSLDYTPYAQSDWEDVVVDDKDILVASDSTEVDSDRVSKYSGGFISQDSSSDIFVDGRPSGSRGTRDVNSIRSVSTTSTRSAASSTREGISQQMSISSYGSQASGGSIHSHRRPHKHDKDKRNNPSTKQRLSNSHVKWRKQQKKRKIGLAALDPLFLPGQILYLYEDEELLEAGCCSSQPVYKARWAHADEFDTIHLDSKMMYHHNPYTIDEALQQILKQEKFSPILGHLDGVVRHQPGQFASAYDYDADESPRRGSSDSGISESIIRQRSMEVSIEHSTEADLGQVNQAFEGNISDSKEPDTNLDQTRLNMSQDVHTVETNLDQTRLDMSLDVDTVKTNSDQTRLDLSHDVHTVETNSDQTRLDLSHDVHPVELCEEVHVNTPSIVMPCREFSIADQTQLFQVMETSTIEIFVSNPTVLKECVGATSNIETYVLGPSEEISTVDTPCASFQTETDRSMIDTNDEELEAGSAPRPQQKGSSYTPGASAAVDKYTNCDHLTMGSNSVVCAATSSDEFTTKSEVKESTISPDLGITPTDATILRDLGNIPTDATISRELENTSTDATISQELGTTSTDATISPDLGNKSTDVSAGDLHGFTPQKAPDDELVYFDI